MPVVRLYEPTASKPCRSGLNAMHDRSPPCPSFFFLLCVTYVRQSRPGRLHPHPASHKLSSGREPAMGGTHDSSSDTNQPSNLAWCASICVARPTALLSSPDVEHANGFVVAQVQLGAVRLQRHGRGGDDLVQVVVRAVRGAQLPRATIPP
jgi:hypothetical protein